MTLTHTKLILLLLLTTGLLAFLLFRVETATQRTEEKYSEVEARVENTEETSTAIIEAQLQGTKDMRRVLNIIDRIIKNQRGLLNLYQNR